MSPEEIAEENRKIRNRRLVIGFLLFSCCGLFYLSGQSDSNQQANDDANTITIVQVDDETTEEPSTIFSTNTVEPIVSDPTETPVNTVESILDNNSTISVTTQITPTDTVTPVELTNTDTPPPDISPTATLQYLVLENELRFYPVSMMSLDEVGDNEPDNGRYLTIFAELLNTTDRSRCIYAGALTLIIDGEEYG